MRHLAPTALVLALAAAATPAVAQQTKSAIWWNSAESGWGVLTADQGSAMVLAWFTHDVDGEPTWFLAATTRQADGSYGGELSRFTGVPLAQIVGNAADPALSVGRVTARFADDRNLSFDWTVNGVSQREQLTRFPFGDRDIVCRPASGSRAGATNYSDLWWTPASAGWGLQLSHVDATVYATWYTYDTDREAVHYQAVTTRQADGSFSGNLFRVRNGTPYAQIDGAPANGGADAVGTARFRFSDGERGSFEYTIGGTTQSKAIERTVFGNTPNVCSVEPFQTDGGGGGGGTQGCFPPYAVGDVREVRYSSTSNGQTSTATRTERIAREGSFQGQAALVEEYSGATSAGTGLYARNYVANGSGTIVSFGAEGYNPATGAQVSTAVNEPLRIEMPRNFTVGQRRELNWVVAGSGGGFTTRTNVRTAWTLQAVESVSVPAGSFQACRFAVETEESTSVSGVGSNTRLTGTVWTSGQYGVLRTQYSGTATITNPFTGNTSTPVSSSTELLSARMGGGSVP